MIEIYALCAIIIFLMAMIVFLEIVHYRQVEKLTNKILADSYKDYAFSNLEYEREVTKRKFPRKDKKIEPVRI